MQRNESDRTLEGLNGKRDRESKNLMESMKIKKAQTVGRPVIIWHSDPVGPDETVLVNGCDFGADARVRLKCAGGEQAIDPLSKTEHSLQFVIPSSWSQDVYSCCIEQPGGESEVVLINAPDIWWKLGDRGVDCVTPGGWLRLFGKCLAFGDPPKVELVSGENRILLPNGKHSGFSVEVLLPMDLPTGRYDVVFHNGLEGCLSVHAGCIDVHQCRRPGVQINVCDFGADPGGKKDSTIAVVKAMERLGASGGGVVFFPAGRYRIDSILRSGVFIKTSLKIPSNVTLRGEGMGLVSLWWPDQAEPLPSLIEGGSDFSIEDLTIYTQGRHSSIVTGDSNVAIRRVRIRANCYYMTGFDGRAHQRRGVPAGSEDPGLGAAIAVWGNNLTVIGCDIFASGKGLDIKHCRGAIISGNTVKAANCFSMCGCSEVLCENNEFSGNQLASGGNNFALFFGATITRHVYFGHNAISHLYGGDHEGLTFDGQGSAYLGKLRKVHATECELAGELQANSEFIGSMHDIDEAVMFIVEGRGRGQYRRVREHSGRRVGIDQPWKVEPDENSLVAIGAFNGRHLIIGNTMTDTGTAVQLYPPNYECIVAENRSARTSNFNCLSKLRTESHHDFVRFEPSWYNQFLDNEVLEGNGWGGGCTEVDRWLGGETCLQVWGWQVNGFKAEGGGLLSQFLTPTEVQTILAENTPRALSIPLAIFNVIRRHKIQNNSSIRIRGRVSEVVIEKCEIRKSARGIRIDSEIRFEIPKDAGQLFDFEPADGEVLEFLSPDNILIRKNSFQDVRCEISGNAAKRASVRIL